jgi:hypothetical protein
MLNLYSVQIQFMTDMCEFGVEKLACRLCISLSSDFVGFVVLRRRSSDVEHEPFHSTIGLLNTRPPTSTADFQNHHRFIKSSKLNVLNHLRSIANLVVDQLRAQSHW